MAIQFLNTVQVDTDVLYVDTANDRVGIGTTSPTALLTLESSSFNPYPGIDIKSTSTYPGSKIRFLNSAGSEVSTIESWSNPSISYLKLHHGFSTASSSTLTLDDGYLYLSTAGSQRMFINSAGNVGIGTTSPGSALSSTRVLDISSNGNCEVILDHTDAGSSSDIGLYSWNRNNDHLAHIKATCDGATDAAFISFHAQATGGSFSGPSSNEKMRIESSGNVGIGTTSPSEKLVVRNGTASTDVKILAYNSAAGTEATLRFSTIASETNYEKAAIIARNAAGSFGRNDMHFALDSAADSGNVQFSDTKMTILNGGNVGIGTTSPGGKLEVNQTATNGNTGAFTSPHLSLTTDTVADTTGFVGITAATSSATNFGYSFGAQRTSGGVGDFKINFHNNSAAGTNRFLIDQSGNVGINDTSPSYKLDVSGTGRFTDILTSDKLLQIPIAGTTINEGKGVGLSLTDDFPYVGNDSTTRYLNHYGMGIHKPLQASIVGANGAYLSGYFGVDIFTAGTSRIHVNQNGNVGIGTTSPGEKLEVAGSVKATASTDAYKGYIKQSIACGAAEKSATANYNLIPYNTLSTTTSNQYYNRMVAAYDGRIKKVYIRDTGGNTPTASVVNIKKQVNDATSSTVYSTTVTGSGAGMSAVRDFADNDFTFSAGDSFGILYQTTDSGGGAQTMGGVAINIIIEYNIT